MFGHNDEDSKQDDQLPDLEVPSPETEHGQNANDDTPAVALSGDNNDSSDWQHPGAVSTDDTPKDEGQDRINDIVSPAGGFPRSTDSQVNSHHAAAPPAAPAPSDELVDTASSDLIDIRQHALTELAPLMDQLDLNPEDRFRTLMLVIQASDDQKLIKQAYEAAHGITDEKARAQALLDLVNEINYFTQPPVLGDA